METKKRIETLIEKLSPICEPWIQEKDGKLQFIDPNDGVEISAHYGATYMAAALILYGRLIQDMDRTSIGIKLLQSILDRWNVSKKLPSFHADFNSFVLCVIADVLNDENPDVSKKIREVILETADNRHPTVNWIPMRWQVNRMRYKWTGDEEYKKRAEMCARDIELATNADGGIEDRLPKGISFNLQYDIATVAVLQYLRTQGVDYDLSRELKFLLNTVSPDGDINYQGRGTNQIFAWGLWIYLLSSSCHKEALEKALDFVEPRVVGMYEKHNIMLNDFAGTDKYLWWDYHYCSVYCAHFLFWLVMSSYDFDKFPIGYYTREDKSETGLHICRAENSFVAYFDGRKEYLSESGPSICYIWNRVNGVICKGAFGPWQGAFGKKYVYGDALFKNYCGVLSINRKKNLIENRYFHRLFPSIKNINSITVQPLFCSLNVNENDGRLEIIWKCDSNKDVILNIPSFTKTVSFVVYADGKEVNLQEVGMIRNQYGMAYLFQTGLLRCNFLKLGIE